MAVTGRIPTLIDLERSRERPGRFVGRSDELAALRAAWPPVSIVFGEPGGGKTRLMAEASRIARTSSVGVTCHPSATCIPLEPLLAVLREVRLPQPKRAEWERPAESGRLIAIRDQLERDGAGGLLIQVDDVQYADDHTLEALLYLADRLRQVPIRWHVASRVGDARVERLAMRLEQMRLGTVIRLREFGMAEFRAFVAATSSQLLDEGEIGELYVLSGGNPLYAEQLIAAAAAGGAKRRAGLDVLLSDRITSLDESRLSLARALSIDSEPLSAETLSRLSSSPLSVLGPIVDELDAAYIAKVSTRGIQFRHDLLRRACYARIPEIERIRLHETMARLSHDPWTRVRHLDGAGLGEKAARELLDHGLAVLDRADREEAAAAFKGALDRATGAADIIVPAKAGLGSLQALAGDIEGALRTMREVEVAAGESTRSHLVGARVRFAEAVFEGSDDTTIPGDFLNLALRSARENAHDWLPRLYTVAGAAADRSGDSNEALRLLRLGIEGCTPATPARELVRLRSWMGVVHGRLGDIALGAVETEAAAATAEANGLSAEFADACVKCCYLADLRGDREAYEAWCRRGISFPGAKLPRTTSVLRLNLATALQDKGDLEEALSLDLAAHDESRDATPTLRAQIGSSLALASAMLGRFNDATQAVADIERLPLSERWRRAVTFVGGRVAEMRGDLEDALAAYEAVARGWVGTHDPEGTDVRAKAGEARVLYALGRRDEVQAVWRFARDGLERGWPLGSSLRAEIEGYALIADGRADEGAASLLEAAKTSKERFRAAYLSAAAGLATADRDLINTAIGEFEEMGAHAASEGIRRKARGIGLRPRHRPRSKHAVTTSDVRIASLIRAGKTNAEIGSQLGLSTKTVEHYVSNMLAKFGLRSRAQLAATIGADAD